MRYYPMGKKCKLDSIWTGPYLIVATLGWRVGIQRHPDEPVRFIHCQDVKKIPQPSGLQSWIMIPPPGGTLAVPMLGASTAAHTSWDSPSVTALPPDEGVELADVDSLRDGRSMSCHSESEHASMPSEGGRRESLTDSVVPEASPFATMALRIDDTSALHPFSPLKSDAGPVRLMTIAHAFNYRMAVLRDGVKSAVRVGRSLKGGRVLPFELRHSMGTTGRADVSDCVHYGVGIGVFSSGIGRLEGRVAKCTFTM